MTNLVLPLVSVAIALVGLFRAASTTGSSANGDDLRGIWVEYETANCSDTPVTVLASIICTFQEYIEGCIDPNSNSSSSSQEGEKSAVVGATGQCTADVSATLDQLYGDQAYIAVDYYTDSACASLRITNVFVADGACHVESLYDPDADEHTILGRVAMIADNGTASVTWYSASDCVGATINTIAYSSEQQSTSECQADSDGIGTIGYTSGVKTSSSVEEVVEDDAGVSTGSIVGVVVACFVALAL